MHLRVPRILLITALASFTAMVFVLPVSSRPVQARDGATFVDLVNEHRADAGVSPVALHSVIDGIAVKRANQMAANREMTHDLEYVKDRLNAAGVCWQGLGEIIAFNGRPESERVERFVQQWYGSDGHRAIMLGAGYTHAGGSWTTASNGYHYAAMIFVKVCGASTKSATPFTDISGSKFAAAIAWVYQQGIMGGCTATTFCPKGFLSRGALATALADGLDLPPTSTDYYADDDGSRYEDGINRLAAAGLTRGCGNGDYCPGQAVRRGALATALAWALGLPATSTDYFSDDEGSRHEANINRIAAAGITAGCGDGRYCLEYRVRRSQAANHLRKAFD